MQTDGSIFVAARKAIFQVAFDGTTDGGELCSYLVMAACFQIDFQQVIVLTTADQTVS